MKHSTKLWIILGIGLVALILEFGLKQQLLAQALITIVGSIISLSMLYEMIKSLKSGDYGVDLLAIMAIVSTLAVSQYWASMIVLIMLVGGDSLEDYASKKAHTELKALLDNSPHVAHRLNGDETEDISVDEANIGDKLVVRPGELVPVDGHVILGQSRLDESSLTGESVPVIKKVGDDIYSGSVNGDASLTMFVDKLAKDSQYQRLVQLVKEADSKPGKFVRMADQYAVPFTAVAVIIAGLAWFISKNPVRFAEVLVVASPCPLILAAPVAIVSGMSRSSRNGIVIKTGDVLEKLATAKTAAFDKTGTITSGKLTVDSVVALDGIDKNKLIELAASSEQASNHILARSLVSYANEQGIDLDSPEELQEETGNGIKAQINGHKVMVGKLEYVAPTDKMKSLPETAVYVSVDDKLWGYVIFLDHIRKEAPETMKSLKEHGVEHIVMLTGDQKAIAEKIAPQVGITDVKADLLPTDKISALKNVSKDRRPVIMIGDGVNDAPSLATADVGIAMGANGSTAASESADIVILKDDLSKVSKAVIIAQDTMRIARQAVLIGIFICIGLMLIASTGIIPALVGAMFQEVVDTVSILWGLRARYSKEKYHQVNNDHHKKPRGKMNGHVAMN